jgi:hypothetical protein
MLRAWLGRSESGLFATRTLSGHLLRGAAAFVLLCLALTQRQEHPLRAVAAALAALAVMRGCPMCWAIGLVETLRQRLQRNQPGAGPR